MTRERLFAAAVRVVDAVGIDALTIRSVALAAELAPLSLYSYFVRKDQLLDLLAEGLGSALLEGMGGRGWPEDLAQLCQNIRGMLLESPRRLSLLSRWVAGFPRPELDSLLDAMVESGMTRQAAWHTLRDAGSLALALATRELSAQSRHRHDDARLSR